MNENKESNLIENRDKLKAAGFSWTTFNNGMQFKIGKTDFYPTTGKWFDTETKNAGTGVDSLIAHLRKPRPKRSGVAELSSLIGLIRRWEDGELSIQALDNKLKERYN